MNYQKACNILELNHGFSLQELKKKYYKKALEFHPDKNNNVQQSEFFKEINEAYSFLNKTTDISDDYEYKCGEESNYNIIVDNFIKLFSNINDKTSVDIIKNIISNYHNLSVKTFEGLDIIETRLSGEPK